MSEPPVPKEGFIGTLKDLFRTSSQADSFYPRQYDPEQSSKGDKTFLGVFGTIMFASRWQKSLSAEKRSRILHLFTNPRDDPWDVYKPNSKLETQILAETPHNKPLGPAESRMLHEIAANLDYCVPLDIIEAYRPQIYISSESKQQLDRLPSWLKFLIILKYDKIHERYGTHSHNFIRMLANKIDMRRSVSVDIYDPKNEEDYCDAQEVVRRFRLQKEDLDLDVRPRNKDDLMYKDFYKLKFAIWKWRLPKTLEQDWAPMVVHRAAMTLRKALLVSPNMSELSIVAEEKQQAKAIIAEDSESEDELYRKPHWEEMLKDKPGFMDGVNKRVEHDLKHAPTGLTKRERRMERTLIKQKTKLNKRMETKVKETVTKRQKKAKKNNWWKTLKRKGMLTVRKERMEKSITLAERAAFRKYSRIWYKNCPKEQINTAKRLPHHYRCDESFHAYCVALVGSSFFKFFIMFVIISNAILLAVETNELKEADDPKWSYVLEILDNLFLSVYLVEFLLKVYAHPYRYWMSGFNVFDFIILLISLVKAVLDWIGEDKVAWLKILVIVRALRILRGISLSIQMQVLITALVETLKTHVLSVLILLFLLMYIASIIAYYIFGLYEFPEGEDVHPLAESWGNIGMGMLNLFSFVTMDGWTDLSEEFEANNWTNGGRFFCVVGLLIGNFLISNIFIAIIIMQISEATEAFRTRQLDEREEIISRKKEIVFRRQKLDMRQLLAKQDITGEADFYYLGSQFLRLLRHDDLVDMNDVPFSPLWMDAFHKSVLRCHRAANVLMNLHREISDNLLAIYRRMKNTQYRVTPIRRGRYNRYIKIKAKMALLRQEFYRQSAEYSRDKPLMVRLPSLDNQKPELQPSMDTDAANHDPVETFIVPDFILKPRSSE